MANKRWSKTRDSLDDDSTWTQRQQGNPAAKKGEQLQGAYTDGCACGSAHTHTLLRHNTAARNCRRWKQCPEVSDTPEGQLCTRKGTFLQGALITLVSSASEVLPQADTTADESCTQALIFGIGRRRNMVASGTAELWAMTGHRPGPPIRKRPGLQSSGGYRDVWNVPVHCGPCICHSLQQHGLLLDHILLLKLHQPRCLSRLKPRASITELLGE